MALNDGYSYREEIGRPGGRTALAYLTERYRHSSRDEWAARFGRGEIELDGSVADGSEPLRRGQVLCWHRPPWQEEDTPQSFELIHEDRDLIAVCKPSGLPTLPAGGFLKHTLLALVQARWPTAVPLHRLGRATSGLVLLARTTEAASSMSRCFRERNIIKRYRALASGRATDDSYEIDAPIGVVPHPRLGSVYAARDDGKAARSTGRVLERRTSETLFEVEIHTGRPEQIRIHLAFIGHPLRGDPMFQAGGRLREEAPGLPGDGGYLLHAESLAFTHPVSGKALLLRAPPPDELMTVEERAPPASGRGSSRA